MGHIVSRDYSPYTHRHSVGGDEAMPDSLDDSPDNETANRGETLRVDAPSKLLTLKSGVQKEVIQQTFSHGRSKVVVVERVKRTVRERDVITKPTRSAANTEKKSKRSKENITPSSPIRDLPATDDASPTAKRSNRRRRSGAGPSLQYRQPSAGHPGSEETDPNHTGRRSNSTPADRYKDMFQHKR
jgi:translation initiation factor IF-2